MNKFYRKYISIVIESLMIVKGDTLNTGTIKYPR